MRWIFFIIMAANLSLLGWQLLVPAHDRTVYEEQAPLASTNKVPPVILLEEVSDQSKAGTHLTDPRSGPSSAEPSPAPLAVPELSLGAADKALCLFVGPFETADRAGQLIERLAAMEVKGSLADVEIPAGQGYWVYLQPLDSRREALRRLSELQARGVDSYVIPKGELMNGISLGMFSKKSLAEARLWELREHNLEAKIDVVERSYKEIWVSVSDASARKLGEQGWQRLLEGEKNIDRRQNFCLHVASQDNIH